MSEFGNNSNLRQLRQVREDKEQRNRRLRLPLDQRLREAEIEIDRLITLVLDLCHRMEETEDRQSTLVRTLLGKKRRGNNESE